MKVFRTSDATLYSEAPNYCAKCWHEFTVLTEEERENLQQRAIIIRSLNEKIERERKAGI